MTSDSTVEHLADGTSGPSGCPRNRETHTSKFQVLHCLHCRREGNFCDDLQLGRRAPGWQLLGPSGCPRTREKYLLFLQEQMKDIIIITWYQRLKSKVQSDGPSTWRRFIRIQWYYRGTTHQYDRCITSPPPGNISVRNDISFLTVFCVYFFWVHFWHFLRWWWLLFVLAETTLRLIMKQKCVHFSHFCVHFLHFFALMMMMPFVCCCRTKN